MAPEHLDSTEHTIKHVFGSHFRACGNHDNQESRGRRRGGEEERRKRGWKGREKAESLSGMLFIKSRWGQQ